MKVSTVTRVQSEDCWFFDELYGKSLVNLYLGDATLILSLKKKGVDESDNIAVYQFKLTTLK